MEKKKGSSEKLEAFFAGKGFYIVLFLCVAVIGVSALIMLTGKTTVVEEDDFSIEDQYVSDSESVISQSTPEIVETEEIPEDSTTEMDSLDEEAEEAAAPVMANNEPAAPTVSEASYVWPLNGEIERAYSVDTLVYDKTMADWRTHTGLDIAAEIGDQVMCVSTGTVELVYEDGLLGTTVIIDHGNGLKSVYANLAETPTVLAGDGVTGGFVIGAVGTTALGETGEAVHLHFAMTQDGKYVDPAEYLP